MNRLVGRIRERAMQIRDLIAAMHKTEQYIKANACSRTILYVDDELRWRSIVRILDSRIIHFSGLLHRSDGKRASIYNRWVRANFAHDVCPVRWQGKGFCLEMPKLFQNAADVVVSDLREIYLENLYARLFPYGRLINDGDVVIDAGANIGAFAIYAALLGSNVKVLAFEPEPTTFEALRRNVEINGLSSQIQCFPYGLAACDGNFALIRNEGCFTMHKLANPERNLNVENAVLTPREQVVRCVTIDQMLDEAEVRRCDVIKMDIEGAERAALRGAVETIQRYRPKLTIAAYHLLSDAYVLPVMVKDMLNDYNILVSREAHLYAFV